jgi:hypothetical protein
VNIEKKNKVRNFFLNIKSFYFEEKNNIASNIIQQIETDLFKKKNKLPSSESRVYRNRTR